VSVCGEVRFHLFSVIRTYLKYGISNNTMNIVDLFSNVHILCSAQIKAVDQKIVEV